MVCPFFYLHKHSTYLCIIVVDGKDGKRVVVAKSSWWPLHHTWCKSDYNFGCWPEVCEDFFQERMAAIVAGTAQPLPLNEWRDKLRILAAVRGFRMLSEETARNYI
jgi:hypothetical protein